MAVVDERPILPRSLVDRARNILLKPSSEWSVIDAEPATIGGLYTGYACILAAIPVLASLIGGQVFGFGALGVTYRPPLIGSLVGAVVAYVLSLAMIYVLAVVIDALASSFDGQRSKIQAFKVAVYASTAGWVAGIFNLFPALGVLGVLGALYGLYLLYLGLPKLMKAPEAKALGYTAVTIIIAIVLFVIVGAVAGAVGTLGFLGAGSALNVGQTAGAGRLSGKVAIPGVGSVDVGKLEQASKQMQAAAEGKTAGGAALEPVAAERLQAMLPASLGAYVRSDVSSSSGGVAGLSGSTAEANYASGESRISLQVTDLGAAAGLASLGGAFNVQSSKQTSTGYERVGKVDGRMTNEEWDSQSRHGKYGVMVADRFMVEADGQGTGMDELKRAVASVNFAQLESIAKATR